VSLTKGTMKKQVSHFAVRSTMAMTAVIGVVMIFALLTENSSSNIATKVSSVSSLETNTDLLEEQTSRRLDHNGTNYVYYSLLVF
jgi:hypothetical protein